MRRHARDARDRSEGRSDLIERGQDDKPKTIMPTRTRTRSRAIQLNVLLPLSTTWSSPCDRPWQTKSTFSTNNKHIAIWNRPKKSTDK